MEFRQPDEAERERSYHAIRSVTAGIDTVRPGAIETAAFLLADGRNPVARSEVFSTMSGKRTAGEHVEPANSQTVEPAAGAIRQPDDKPSLFAPIPLPPMRPFPILTL
jgi:hypothetical protein